MVNDELKRVWKEMFVACYKALYEFLYRPSKLAGPCEHGMNLGFYKRRRIYGMAEWLRFSRRTQLHGISFQHLFEGSDENHETPQSG
jgi:hypothetical protein